MIERTRNSDLFHWVILLLVFAAVFFIGAHFAHAGVGPSEAPAPAVALTVLGLPWQAWVVLGLAAFAGVRAIVDTLLAFFKAEAPLTATLVDDHFRDSLQSAHDKLDKLAGTINVLVDATKPAGGIRVIPGSGTAAMLAVLLLGALAAPALTGCTAAQVKADATAVERTLINCTAQELGARPGLDIATLVAVVNLAATERAKCSSTGSLDWKCIEQDLIAQGKVLGGCTLVSMVTAAVPAKPAGSALTSQPAAPPGRSELEDFRARVAPGVTYHTGAGDL